jgi:hypothetical protein
MKSKKETKMNKNSKLMNDLIALGFTDPKKVGKAVEIYLKTGKLSKLGTGIGVARRGSK